MMSRQLLLLIVLITTVMTNLLRKKRSIIEDGGNHTNNCVGSLQLVTNTETIIFTKNMTRVLVKNIARVVVEGTCCATIYSGRHYRGRSDGLSGQGEFLTRLRKVKSVILTSCSG